jgi:hypothetical protein
VAWFLILWLVLIGAEPADLAVGALSAALATWVSLLLLPPGRAVRSPAGMARLEALPLKSSAYSTGK